MDKIKFKGTSINEIREKLAELNCKGVNVDKQENRNNVSNDELYEMMESIENLLRIIIKITKK